MKEYPILFSGPMIRAILDGKKTQTRRVIKPQPVEVAKNQLVWKENTGHGAGAPVKDAGWWFGCPYGYVEDRLWVRETWNCIDTGIKTQRQDWVRYRATDGDEMCWRPSIHMPRWASRITLEITEVRVERLQSISEADALAEGINWEEVHHSYSQAIGAFADLWDNINGKRGFGWDTDPWVWVLGFKVVQS